MRQDLIPGSAGRQGNDRGRPTGKRKVRSLDSTILATGSQCRGLVALLMGISEGLNSLDGQAWRRRSELVGCPRPCVVRGRDARETRARHATPNYRTRSRTHEQLDSSTWSAAAWSWGSRDGGDGAGVERRHSASSPHRLWPLSSRKTERKPGSSTTAKFFASYHQNAWPSSS